MSREKLLRSVLILVRRPALAGQAFGYRQCLIQPMLRSRQLTSRKTIYRLIFQKGGNRFQELRPPSVWPVQMKKMGSAGNDYNLHSSRMNKIGCEMFPIFL